MSVYVCRFCGEVLHCDFYYLKRHAGCPFEPCLSKKCKDAMDKFGDKEYLCCDSCYVNYLLIRNICVISSIYKIARVVSYSAEGFSALAADSVRYLDKKVHYKESEVSFFQSQRQNMIHEKKTKNALRRNPPAAKFWHQKKRR